MFIVFVPAHVDRRRIYPCVIDNETTFIRVDSEQQAVAQQKLSSQPFIVFEKSYFTVYNIPGGPAKCDYVSRNFISLAIYFGYFDKFRWAKLAQKNGLMYYPEPPVIYFVPVDSIKELNVGLLNDNTIVFRYKTVDIAQFAETTKIARGCCTSYFILYEDGIFQCFSVSNSKDSNTPIPTPKDSPMPGHHKKLVATNTSDAEERGRSGKRQPPARLPNGDFRLRDRNGKEVRDGENFVLITFNHGESDDDDSDGSVVDGCSSDRADSIIAGVHVMDRTLMARPGTGHVFTCETVKGIVYLKHDGQYLCCPEDDVYAICLISSLPQQSERLQINYDRGDIILTKWDGSLYATCDWASSSIGFIGLDGEGHSWRSRDALRIHIARA